MFKKTIAKAAIGALALSSVATQAVSRNDFAPYVGGQWALQLAVPDDNRQTTSTTNAAWKDFLPSKKADFSNFTAAFGAALNPRLTWGIPIAVEVIGQNFAKSEINASTTTINPKREDSLRDTGEQLAEAVSEVTWLDSTFKGAQGKANFAIGESLDVVLGLGGGILSTQKTNAAGAFAVHVGAKYHISDHGYIPFGIQYYGNPFSQSSDSLNHMSFNIGGHYHF